MVRLYCFLRLNLNTSVFSPRPCATIVPLTRACSASAPALTDSPSTTASTRPNSTSAPTSPSSVSISIASPGVTRYCFPPVSITAYIQGSPRGGLSEELRTFRILQFQNSLHPSPLPSLVGPVAGPASRLQTGWFPFRSTGNQERERSDSP